MTIEGPAVPRATGHRPATETINIPCPVRIGVLAELADWGRPGDARSVSDLVQQDEWPFLEAVWRIEPRLVWIAWWSGSCSSPPPDLIHPIRVLKRRLSQRGVGRSAWKRLVGASNENALALFKRGGGRALEAHLRLETVLDRALPFAGPPGEWVQRFEWRCMRGGHFTVERSSVELPSSQAARLLELGLARLADGSFESFANEELPLVLRYWSQCMPGQRLPRWATLLIRARAAHASAAELERSQSCRWDSGEVTTDFGGYRISALSDSYALWREGLTMRHCIAEYAERCVDDGLRVFHLQSQTSRTRWTLALAPDSDDTWRVHEVRGPRNRVADADTRAVAHAWALAYAGIFPPGENGLVPLDEDDDEQRCPICRRLYCEEHLVATLEIDEGLMAGCLYDDWNDRMRQIQTALKAGLLASRLDAEWPNEVASIYAALLCVREQIVVLDRPGHPDAEWIIDDVAFTEACREIGTTRLLLNSVEEWLLKQPGIVSHHFEIPTAPGLIWVGRNVHSRDPEPIRQRFLREFCPGPDPATARASGALG